MTAISLKIFMILFARTFQRFFAKENIKPDRQKMNHTRQDLSHHFICYKLKLLTVINLKINLQKDIIISSLKRDVKSCTSAEPQKEETREKILHLLPISVSISHKREIKATSCILQYPKTDIHPNDSNQLEIFMILFARTFQRFCKGKH